MEIQNKCSWPLGFLCLLLGLVVLGLIGGLRVWQFAGANLGSGRADELDSTADLANVPNARGELRLGASSELEQANANQSVEIPFILTEHNNISISVVLNEKHKLSLMFHTGNSNVCLTTEATQRLHDIEFDQQADVESWGGDSETRYSLGHSLQIGDRSWDDVLLFEDKLSGHGTDGKFGPDLFAGKVVEIDFDRQLLIVHDSLPKMDADYQQFECRRQRSSIFISGELQIGGDKLTNEFMIHSGFSGTILLDDEFVSQNNLNRLDVISESELRDSFGNVMKTKKVQVPSLSFGNSSLVDIPIGFFEGAIGQQKMSIVGGDVLKRFNMILEIDRPRVYMKPNGLFDLEFGT